ncbi:MAG: hypothetical protein AVDCRST_MAG30-3283, partial [uncultured Solirubrobacteraceae bacterium]
AAPGHRRAVAGELLQARCARLPAVPDLGRRPPRPPEARLRLRLRPPAPPSRPLQRPRQRLLPAHPPRRRGHRGRRRPDDRPEAPL